MEKIVENIHACGTDDAERLADYCSWIKGSRIRNNLHHLQPTTEV